MSTPSAEGIDPAGVNAMLDALESHPAIEPHSLTIVRHGRVVCEGWWAPYDGNRPYLVYSLSKSFTATALGIAVGEGLVDLDAPALAYFPEIDRRELPERMQRMLVRHLVSMRSGHRHDTWLAASASGTGDMVRAFFELAPEDEPGTAFAYNQPPIVTISEIIRRTSGQNLTDYLRPRLFDPLRIDVAAWQQDAAGRDYGFSGLFTTTRALVRLGELYLRDGRWLGTRLLPEGWAALARTAHADTGQAPSIDWQQGYGFGFWMSSHGYRGDGAYGQYCLILPEQDAVVVITSATSTMQAVLDEVWRHLLPSFTGATRDAAADDRLADRMRALQLPPAPGTDWHPDLTRWPTGTFLPFGGSCAARPTVTAVALAASGRLVLHDHAGTYPIEVGQAPHDALAVAAAGWADDATLLLDLVFVQSPHRMWMVLDCRTNTFTADWATAPLRARALDYVLAPKRS